MSDLTAKQIYGALHRVYAESAYIEDTSDMKDVCVDGYFDLERLAIILNGAHTQKERSALRLAKMAIAQGSTLNTRISANGPSIGEVIDRALNSPSEATHDKCTHEWEGGKDECTKCGASFVEHMQRGAPR